MPDPFHVRHQADPHDVAEVLRLLGTALPTMRADLAHGLDGRLNRPGLLDEQLARLRLLGLLGRADLVLTDKGELASTVLSKHAGLYADLMHFWHYAAWDGQRPEFNRFSWTYRSVCRHLWRSESVGIDTRQLLESVMTDLLSEFTGEEAVSISLRTVSGVIRWLECLEPPVVIDKVFACRGYAPLEVVVLAVDKMYRDSQLSYGELLVIDDAATREVATACLVHEGALAQLFEDAARRFPWFGLESRWGYFVRLTQEPHIVEDVL